MLKEYQKKRDTKKRQKGCDKVQDFFQHTSETRILLYLYNTPPVSINLYQSSVRLFKYEQEVGDNLSVCVLNILPKVSSLANLLAINLVKVEIYIF